MTRTAFDQSAYAWKALQDVTTSDEGKVRAVVATFDVVDNDGEVILAGAIPDGMKVTASSYNHDTVNNQLLGMGMPDAPPVAKGVIRIEGSKAVAYLDYFMETTRGREAFLTIKAMGRDQAWSFAYRKLAVQKPNAEWQAKGARLLLVKLGPLLDGAMECSPVKQPGGKFTQTLGTKSVADTEHQEAVAQIARMKAFAAELKQRESKWQRPRPVELDEWLPPYETEKVAKIAFVHGIKRLGIRQPPAMKFFRPLADTAPWGQYLPDRNEIWISIDQPCGEVVDTVLHELVHTKAFERGEGEILGDEWGEAEARATAGVIARTLFREGVFEGIDPKLRPAFVRRPTTALGPREGEDVIAYGKRVLADARRAIRMTSDEAA